MYLKTSYIFNDFSFNKLEKKLHDMYLTILSFHMNNNVLILLL